MHHVNIIKILSNENHFPKTAIQEGFGYGIFTKSPRIFAVSGFSPSSLKLKGIILPLLSK